jgi:hypothetical protein
LNTSTIETKLLAIENLMYPYFDFWQNEILDLHLQNKIPSSWLQDDFLIDFQQTKNLSETGKLQPSHPWYELSLKLTDLSELPKLSQVPTQNYISKDVKAKKIYEINQLLSHITTKSYLQAYEHIVDLAGGKGHLSSAILKSYPSLKLRRTVIDKNHHFKFNISNPDIENFLCLDLLNAKNLPITKSDHLYLLHGCGSLTDQSIELQFKHQCRSLCLVGCCYHLIKEPIDFFSKNLTLSSQALHLATKTHRDFTDSSWAKLKNQKHYRYSIGLWFNQKFRCPMPALKSSPRSLYQDDFSAYSKEQLKRLNIDVRADYLQELNDCYTQNYEVIEKLIKLGTIRLLFSRPLEVYIGLRRALKLSQTKANQIMIGEIFDRKISPRNILLFCKNF